jgi:glucose/arabinose dehydrogenase
MAAPMAPPAKLSPIPGDPFQPVPPSPRRLRASWSTLLCAVLLAGGCSRAERGLPNWQDEWELPKGFSIDIDVEDFSFPTAIAFVPNPGPDPKSPLYFVTELRGKVKVVTRDRSVHTFAENTFAFTPVHELPATEAESGMAGIALDPAHGYVFVSLAYHDRHRVLRNNIVRFQSEPGVFSLQSKGAIAFTDLFDEGIAAITHQAGAMIVDGNTLLVGVGDGGQHFKSQQLTSILGKVLRMTLEGKPLPDNPFYEDDDVNTPANYVWAYGLRNPFGLSLVNGRLFASENGFDMDRFLEIRRGVNYGWDGTDWSIGINALSVLGPTTVSPVHVQWMPPDNPLFPPEYRSRFYVVFHGGKSFLAGLATFDVDFERSRMAAAPRQFALHTTERRNRAMPVGVALGPDGLYLAPLFPVRGGPGGKGAVLKIVYAPDRARQGTALTPDERVEHNMIQKGCYNCHGRQPTDLNVAPPLDRETLVPRILTRLDSSEYPLRSRLIDELDLEPYTNFREARRQVLAAQGKERARLWMKYHVLEPRFDQTASAMPTLDLTESEAEEIANYLMRRNLGDIGVRGFFMRVAQPYLYGPASRRHLPGAFAMGFGSACVFLFAARSWRRRAARRAAARAATAP